MARTATPKTKGRTARQTTRSAAKDIPADAPRRGRKTVREAEPAEPRLADAPVPGGDEAAPQPELTATTTDGGEAKPAPARRGRRAKADPVADAAVKPEEASPAEEAGRSAPPPAKARRAGRRKIEAATPSSQSPAEQPADQPADAVAAETPAPIAPAPSAARWDAATGTASFDWPAIEQVAAVDGPNQGMALLLLAARAEGANSRWPF